MDRSYERIIEELTDIANDADGLKERLDRRLGDSEEDVIMKAEMDEIRKRLNNSCKDLESLLK